MYLHQRQEQLKSSSIEGRKIINNVKYTKKELRTLSPQLYEPLYRQQTFQTDSFKEILTRRSGSNLHSKENISINQRNLKRIKEVEGNAIQEFKKKNQIKKTMKSRDKKKGSISATKFTIKERPKEEIKRQRKSYSPVREYREYRSGPTDRRNYISNNISSKTSRQGILIPNKSQKNLATDRFKNGLNPLETFLQKPKKQKHKSKQKVLESRETKKKKKEKNTSKNNLSTTGTRKKKQSSKIQELAKEFDNMLKESKGHTNKKSKKRSGEKKKRKVVMSNQASLVNLTNQKHKIVHISEYSSDSSPERVILNNKYKNEKSSKSKNRIEIQNHGRRSFQPHSKANKNKKQFNKVKTEQYSPEKLLVQEINRNQAAIAIQKKIRAFIDRNKVKRRIQAAYQIYQIENKIKGFLATISYTNLPHKKQQHIIDDHSENIDQFMGSPELSNFELMDLLEDILKEEKVSNKMKQKIQQFLVSEKSVRNSARSSLHSHHEQQIKSQRRFFQQQLDRSQRQILMSPEAKAFYNTSRISPRLQKQQLKRSPSLAIENLNIIKQFQMEKMVAMANMQRQGIDNLTMKKVFSPHTQSLKKKEIQQKLKEELQKFDKSIEQVIEAFEEPNTEVQPFKGILTPQQIKNEHVDQENNGLGDPLQDQSMQLLEYYEQTTQHRHEQTGVESINNRFEFIEEYELNLFQFLRQKGWQYQHNFLIVMKTFRNLQPELILKNLHLITEDSEDDDMAFKLPMYKYLENEEKELISPQITQEFNQQFTLLQRHRLPSKSSNIEEIYIKMLIDCINQALSNKRPLYYMFTETSLANKKQGRLLLDMGKINSSRSMREIGSEDSQYFQYNEEEQQFEVYFASAMNQIYKWAHLEAGMTESEDYSEQDLIVINQKNFEHLLDEEASKKWQSYDELLQIIAWIEIGVFDNMLLEAMYEIWFCKQ